MKGIILAGGSGTRLYPLTLSVSKQLLPVYDKPMIYYPLSILMQAGIREVMIISTPEDTSKMEKSLGDGSNFGISITYAVQEKPEGIAQSFLIAENFIADSPVCLILGDNIFHGDNLEQKIKRASKLEEGGLVFGYRVSDPERYGVVVFDDLLNVQSVIEKPKEYISSYAVTGLYFYDSTVVSKAKALTPSARGELEITDIQNLYLSENKLKVDILDSGTAWLDAGTFDSLMEASQYVQVIEKRQGRKIACLEEIAFTRGWITKEHIIGLSSIGYKNSYSEYLKKLI